jgi:hypothetical protein
VRQRDVEQGLKHLAWVGVLDLGRDARRRLVAVRLTEAGVAAIQ